MINNWKLGLKSLKYAYGIKPNFFLMIVFMLISLVFYTIGPRINSRFLGGYMLMCMAILPTQMVYSLSVSNIVQSSPLKKKMQTIVPAVFTCGNLVIMYLINVLIYGVMVWVHPESVLEMGNEVLLLALTMMVMSIYMGLAYKYFAVSVIMFLFVYFSLYIGKNFVILDQFGSGAVFFGIMALLGLASVVVGGVMQYWVSLLVYKAPMSKMAQVASLRKEL